MAEITVSSFNVKLHTQLTDKEIIEGAASLGVGIMSAQPHYLQDNSTGKFIFGYSELTSQQIQEGICRLAKVIVA